MLLQGFTGAFGLMRKCHGEGWAVGDGEIWAIGEGDDGLCGSGLQGSRAISIREFSFKA